jgi:tetratricopeptide (TPR) repeat protein
MRTVPLRLVVLAVAAVQLGGCTSFLGIKFARQAQPEPAVENESTLAAAPITEAARKQLSEGQTGLAVETFKQALAAGEPQAPAVNGLGVAFARLGRFDLAHRFFSQAMEMDPADSRYADNLARMMRSPELLAMRRDADIAAAAQERLAAAQAEVEARAAARPSPGKIERLSRGEVRIATAPPQAQPTVKTVRSATADGFKPLIRVTFADKAAEQPKGFVRIVLPEPDEAEMAEKAEKSAAYGPKEITFR